MKQSRFSFRKFLLLSLSTVMLPYIGTLFWTYSAAESSAEEIKQQKQVILERGLERTVLDLEEYLIGVTAVQVPETYEKETLKAQAILARTALYRQMDGENSIPEDALDLDYMDKEQMEKQLGSENASDFYERLREAVQETSGKVICWNGDYIEPLFHRVSAGKTRQGSGDEGYLVSVMASEAESAADFYFERSFTKEEISRRLNHMIPSPEIQAEHVLESIQIVEKDGAGYVKRILIGSRIYDGDSIRWALELPSSAFHLEERDERVSVTVKGNGHGYGLEQYGANEKAKAGWTAEQILHYYYKNIVICTE